VADADLVRTAVAVLLAIAVLVLEALVVAVLVTERVDDDEHVTASIEEPAGQLEGQVHNIGVPVPPGQYEPAGHGVCAPPAQ
jgi:hypothetical protein